ncbi:DUF4139 domain-containing protein [Lysobacter sp. S4-A87]|uniref:DUF4139 domain-containing protein n=1 Tax=Lysobacter sp. S4-A87 TaxID=2925843 RepID=UPI001F539D39|nr:DUF4139 domain-containing protein [Lysobacter sp. S4-A87]UNK49451.1 DUF4139 domain-containing protein [Lysobacter sp. S4-A87]
MKHPLSLLALACSLAACSGPKPPQATGDEGAAGSTAHPSAPSAPSPASQQAEGDDAAQTRLTVYSGGYDQLANSDVPQAGMPGYALVDRRLDRALKQGENAIAADDVPPSMDVEAAALRPLTAGIGIVGQRYIAALSGTDDVLAQAIGNKVTVEHTAGGAKQTDTGTLLSAGDGLTLALDDGRIKVIRNYDSFSLVDAQSRLPRHAALQWTVTAPRAGDAQFQLSYPMGGMAWRAEYLATLAKGDGCRLALDGAALIANRSGVTFDDATVSLVAGEPNVERMQAPRGRVAMDRMEMASPAAPPPPMPTVRESGEYHAYDLPGRVRVAHGSNERVPLFAPRPSISCERAYVVEADGGGWEPPQPVIAPSFRGATGMLPVTTTVTVSNSKEAGLGQPLPAGRVRTFVDGDFLGESMLPHTATGEEIRLQVGKAFDLRAKREPKDFRLDRAGRTITETFELTLTNGKKTAATIRVIEPLPRWSDWELVASSVPGKKKDAQHAQFEVPVAAGNETTLTYTVRYRWSKDVTP